ncbi:dipeptide ABC transporter ATP-binding protein [Limnochorda pilosa]|uniref:Glutathione ABC transporter ATP-binding protein n=1 Tax=Limnochorda pilosa TaxID=1555112 RepID=A0A0K2SH64_LIMPI|nr:ABC transporter ATP-binding protein [Limnochorda pilosa]BAS26435.1 glutathione ABC transporter ATP-binding protein [Limnochorda pilosa]
MALLEVRGLTLHYAGSEGPVPAVDSLSLSIAGPGEALGLIGDSGSGKTTLARVLIRSLPRQVARLEGRVLLGGRDVLALPEETFRLEVRWKQIAVVFQGALSAFNPVLRVGFQVAERMLLEGTPRAEAEARARALLEQVGLPGESFRRYPHELSGGMRQRAAIAMALSLGPKLLVLDEPTSALDVSVQAQIMNLLKRLKWETGLSMLFITHDLALASDLCDRIAVLQEGRLLECGTADQVLTAPRHPHTRALLARVPRLHGPEGAGGGEAGAGRKEVLLALEDMHVHFQARRGLLRAETVRALDGVTLEVRRGEALAVVGESGSGKTTLGRATLGLVTPAGGWVRFDGQELAGLDARGLKAFRRRAQAVFQDPYASLSPYMSVQEIVEEPLLVHGPVEPAERRQRALEALAAVGLDPPEAFADRYPHGLSGGQRQRVAIARAMVLDPEYLVADEPVSMVDASQRAEILDVLRALRADRDLTLLYITHDLASARHFADRIAALYLGSVVELAPAGTLVEQPLHPYTRSLLQAVPEPDPANRTRLRPVVPGEPPSAARVPPGCPFHPRCPEAIAGWCEVERPRLLPARPDHWVACHLHEAGGATGAQVRVERAQEEGAIPSHLEPHRLALALVALARGVSRLYVEFQGEVDPQQLFDVVFDALAR